MKKFLNAFNKTLAVALAIVMTVSLFSSWSLHSSAEGEVTETVAETMVTPTATPFPTVASVSKEAPTETEVPTTTEAPVATATPSVEEKFDVQATYDALMACTEYAQVEAIVNGISEEETSRLKNGLSEEELILLETHLKSIYYVENTEGEVLAAVNYDDVAEFVQLQPAVRLFAARNISEEPSDESNGLEMAKHAERLADGTYKITLEAYTTGSVKAGEAKSSDIVLLLDLSTSMESNFSESSYKYSKVYSLNTNETYYADDSHIKVTYCSQCNAWTNNCGWFLSHIKGTQYTPLLSESDTTLGAVQFYSREQVTEVTRLEALQQSMSAFVSQIAAQETDDRVALIYFHRNAGFLVEGDTDSTAFHDATTDKDELVGAINSIEGSNWYGNGDLDVATEHGKGIEKVVEIFKTYTTAGEYNSGDRNKVVVLVTDGEPAPANTNAWSSRVVKQAIDNSYILKNTYNASVYTVSVMPGTNASNPTSDMDKYMDYVSSNYTLAQYTGTNIDDRNLTGDSYYDPNGNDSASNTETEAIINQITAGTKINTENGSFYLTASDTSTLDSIFGQIAEQTGGSSINLGNETVINDVISEYFTLPDGADESSITVTTKDAVFTDTDNDGIKELGWTTSTIVNFTPTITIDSKDVKVEGFDFTHNFIAETGREEGNVSQAGNFHGRKLVIEFVVIPEYTDNYIGGNNVPTNGMTSGIYDSEGNLVEAFTIPTVNVPLNVTGISISNKTIYEGNSTDISSLYNNYKFVNDNYISTVVTYTDANGNNVASTNITPKECSDYTITVTYTPAIASAESIEASNGFVAENTQQTAEATVHVLNPKVDVGIKDIERNYGDSYILGNDNDATITVAWVDKNTSHANIPAAEGSAPFNNTDLSIIYSAANMTVIDGMVTVPSKDFNITVKVQKNGEDYTTNVTITTNCSYGCSPATHTNGYYTVHVKSLPLTINKTFESGTTPQVGETFIFTVKGTGTATSSVNMTVTLVAKKNDAGQIVVAPITINNLPIGEYKVEEDTSWNWRYKPVDESGNEITDAAYTITLGAVQEVTFKNKVVNKKWIDSNAYCENTFAAVNTSGTATSNKVQVK